MSSTVGFLKKIGCDILILIFFPLLLLLFNNAWIFTDAFNRWIDPWVYTGYFLDFSQHSKIFAGTYYGSRLGWILPGAFAYKIFPPLVANYVLHLLFFYLALFSLYLILRYTIGQRIALLVALFMSGYSYFLWAIGWDYPDGAGITYFLLTALMLTTAAKFSKWRASLFMGGSFYACMVYSNLFLATFAFPLVLYYFLTNNRCRRNSFLASSIFFVGGFTALTLLFGLINYLINRNFLFFLPSIRWVLEHINKPNPWKASSFAWVTQAAWLLLPLAVFIGSFISLFSYRISRHRENSGFGLIFQSVFIFVFIVMIFWEIKGIPVLELQFYSSYLIPFMFLAIASPFISIQNSISNRQFFLLICSAIIMYSLPYFLFNTTLLPEPHTVSLLTSYKHLILLPFVSLSFGILMKILTSKSNRDFLFIFFLCLSFAILNVITADIRVIKNSAQRTDGFHLVVKAVQAVKTLDPESQGDIYFWYRREGEALGNVYGAIASTYLWGYRLVNEKFPDIMEGRCYINGREIETIRKIVILSSDKNSFQSAREALIPMGLTVRPIYKKNIQEGNLSFDMVFIECLK